MEVGLGEGMSSVVGLGVFEDGFPRLGLFIPSAMIAFMIALCLLTP